MTVLVDDVRLETWPREGVQFRVYLSTKTIPLETDLVGTTQRAIWPSAVLSPGTSYSWQIVMLVDGNETRSPVWRFTTAPVGPVDRFAWRILADPNYAGHPFPVVLEAVDASGRVVPDYSSRTTVGGQADGGAPPQVVISELIEDGTAMSLAEGQPGATTAQVRLLFPLNTNLTVTLTASPTDQIVLAPEVVVAAGSTEAEFEVLAPDNVLLDGTRAIVVSAAASWARTCRSPSNGFRRLTALTTISTAWGAGSMPISHRPST
ncbi:MAG TPA: hypothetical protein PK640_18320 [Verrucomicrobiota bacterium]|nr:hypothetical protein [Verrucomicrobiota bacterium]